MGGWSSGIECSGPENEGGTKIIISAKNYKNKILSLLRDKLQDREITQEQYDRFTKIMSDNEENSKATNKQVSPEHSYQAHAPTFFRDSSAAAPAAALRVTPAQPAHEPNSDNDIAVGEKRY